MSEFPALGPGDMGSVFADFTERWAQYSPRVLMEKPFIATLDDFVSDAEIDAILGSVSSQFARSTDQGAVDKYGEQKKVVSQGRTSENAWCTGTATARALRPSGMKLRPHLSSGASAGATTCPRRRPCSAASRT